MDDLGVPPFMETPTWLSCLRPRVQGQEVHNYRFVTISVDNWVTPTWTWWKCQRNCVYHTVVLRFHLCSLCIIVPPGGRGLCSREDCDFMIAREQERLGFMTMRENVVIIIISILILNLHFTISPVCHLGLRHRLHHLHVDLHAKNMHVKLHLHNNPIPW